MRVVHGRPWLAAASAAPLAIAALVVDPASHPVRLPCPLKVTTGFDCPLCGATRASYALVHGDVVSALDLNALAVVAAAAVLVGGALWALGRRLHLDGRVAWVAAVVAVVWTVVRNLPVEPFRVLASSS